mgnify:CR=1 FL=1
MKLDFYLKFILSVIAAGVLGLNIYFFKPQLINEVYANQSKIISVYSEKRDIIYILSEDGKNACYFYPYTSLLEVNGYGKWKKTGC